MKTIRRKTDAFVATLLLAWCSANLHAGVQTHASIREAAREHVLAQAERFTARPEVTIGNLDSRLKLNACELPLETYDSPNGLNGGRGVVGVRCTGSTPWKIYVPVEVALIDKVVVNRRPLVRGDAVQADDLMLMDMDISGLRQAYFTRIEDVAGLRSKRAIAAGTTLHAGLLKRARLVKRGSQVAIIAAGGGLQVQMRGKALADGGRGDRIQVKNLSSGRIVTGTITAQGVIQVVN